MLHRCFILHRTVNVSSILRTKFPSFCAIFFLCLDVTVALSSNQKVVSRVQTCCSIPNTAALASLRLASPDLAASLGVN